MNILLISRCPPYPLYLGDRLIVYHLVRQLARRGHVIDLLAFSDRFEDITERGQYADLFRQITIVADPPRTSFDYALRLARPGARFPRQAERAWSPTMWEAIRHQVTANQYDVAHLFGGIQVYEYAHAVEPLPAIITPYESYSLYLRRVVENAESVGAQRAAPLQQWIDQIRHHLELRAARSFESWMFTPYKRVVVVSERDREELRGLNSSLPVEVIPNGVDLDYFHLNETPESLRKPNTILFTGNYEYAPNVDAALHLARVLFPRIRERVPSAKLWIVGNAPPPGLEALANDAITVTGHVPDMRTYLEKATVFVCPLRLGAGIKNKVLEALALRLPVIATPLSVDGIAVRDGHEALIAHGDDALVEATLRLLADPALQKQLGTNGRGLIETRYSWRQVAERYEAIYSEVTL